MSESNPFSILLASLLGLTLWQANPAEASGTTGQTPRLILQGGITYDGSPKVGRFVAFVDSQLPCWQRQAMDRLIRVAHNSRLRRLVWKRMLHQELMMISGKEVRRIQRVAAQCDMPISG